MRRAGLWIGVVLVAVVILAALLSLVWTPYNPLQVQPTQVLRPAGWPHLLGTDGFGIDILSRLLIGARTTVYVGVVAVSLAALGGVPLGVLAGMRGGWVSEIVLRVSDILYAFARVARAATLIVMTQDYILAARASGTSRWTTSVRHVLPNIAAVLGVQASVSFGIAILAEAALSYLGLATPPPTPTWGRMLHDAQTYIFTSPVQALWPGLAIALSVLGLNLLGDGLRDHLDPRLREAA